MSGLFLPPETIVKTTLKAHAGVAAIVADRIYEAPAPEGTAKPCITFSMIGAMPAYLQENVQNLQDPRVQIDLWADIQAKSVLSQLRLAVLDCLYASDSPPVQRYFFIENDGTDMDEPSARLARKMIEARLWYDITV